MEEFLIEIRGISTSLRLSQKTHHVKKARNININLTEENKKYQKVDPFRSPSEFMLNISAQESLFNYVCQQF